MALATANPHRSAKHKHRREVQPRAKRRLKASPKDFGVLSARAKVAPWTGRRPQAVPTTPAIHQATAATARLMRLGMALQAARDRALALAAEALVVMEGDPPGTLKTLARAMARLGMGATMAPGACLPVDLASPVCQPAALAQAKACLQLVDLACRLVASAVPPTQHGLHCASLPHSITSCSCKAGAAGGDPKFQPWDARQISNGQRFK